MASLLPPFPPSLLLQPRTSVLSLSSLSSSNSPTITGKMIAQSPLLFGLLLCHRSVWWFWLCFSCSWLGLIGQFRPKKLISSIKGEFTNADEFEWPAFKDVAKHVFDKSVYSLGLFSQLSLSSSSVLLSTERHGDKRRPRYKMMLWHEVFLLFIHCSYLYSLNWVDYLADMSDF